MWFGKTHPRIFYCHFKFILFTSSWLWVWFGNPTLFHSPTSWMPVWLLIFPSEVPTPLPIITCSCQLCFLFKTSSTKTSYEPPLVHDPTNQYMCFYSDFQAMIFGTTVHTYPTMPFWRMFHCLTLIHQDVLLFSHWHFFSHYFIIPPATTILYVVLSQSLDFFLQKILKMISVLIISRPLPIPLKNHRISALSPKILPDVTE